MAQGIYYKEKLNQNTKEQAVTVTACLLVFFI